MKKFFYLGMSLCSILVLISCGNKENNYQAIETVSQPNDSMMVVSGLITKQTGPNMMSIVSMEGDTIWFTKDGAIIEGSGLIIGDSATIYYTINDIIPVNDTTVSINAKKIVTTKSTHSTNHNMNTTMKNNKK